jgi:hypothetical protein
MAAAHQSQFVWMTLGVKWTVNVPRRKAALAPSSFVSALTGGTFAVARCNE